MNVLSGEGSRLLDKVGVLQQNSGAPSYLHEALVVNDRGTDAGACAHTVTSHYPGLKVLINSKQMAKRYSVKCGVLAAVAHWIFCADADLVVGSKTVSFSSRQESATQQERAYLMHRKVQEPKRGREDYLSKKIMESFFVEVL
jgi:hypothetical protein